VKAPSPNGTWTQDTSASFSTRHPELEVSCHHSTGAATKMFYRVKAAIRPNSLSSASGCSRPSARPAAPSNARFQRARPETQNACFDEPVELDHRDQPHHTTGTILILVRLRGFQQRSER